MRDKSEQQQELEPDEPEFEPCAVCGGRRDSQAAIWGFSMCYRPCIGRWYEHINEVTNGEPGNKTGEELTALTRAWVEAQRKVRAA